MTLRENLEHILSSLGSFGPELTIAGVAILVLLVGLFPVPKNVIRVVAALAVLSLFLIPESAQSLFNGHIFRPDGYRNFLVIFVVTFVLCLGFSTPPNQRSTHYFLLLCVLLGSVLMMQSVNFLLIYLSVELASYSAYALTNFTLKKESHEAAIKYLLFGGVSSAVMLFGISMLYGTMVTGQVPINHLYGYIGTWLFVGGLLFKISIVPFHIWVPNVYQAGPTDAVAFFSIVPKLGALMLLRQLVQTFPFISDGVLALGILTIAVGTLAALRQTNVRRLISYGAIAHSGFLLPLAVLPVSLKVFSFYAAVYALMNVAIFYVLDWFEKNDIREVQDFTGLGKKLVVPGVAVTVILISLIGLPPTGGFTAKLMLFSSLGQHYATSANSLVLVYLLVAVFATAVSLYFYLRVPYSMFLKEGRERTINFPRTAVIWMLVLALIQVVIFVAPGWL
jgi:NADH-quinone oxidoreductase subunit N